MADISRSEDPPFGKRKRSPGSLVLPSDPSDVAVFGSVRSSFLDNTPLPKRPRLPDPDQHSRIGLLPPGLLQHVFSYIDPFSLASIASVNRLFRSLLDERYSQEPVHCHDDKHPIRNPDSLWSGSRRRYIPTMPKPVDGLSERAQFLLCFGLRCNFCGKKPLPQTSRTLDPWRAGPGDRDVRIIWPFRLRSCTDCLLSRMQKDVEIVLSDASPLLPGLPFALFTQSMDYIPDALIRDGLPLGIVLQKFSLRSDLVALEQRLQQAKSYGPAAAEEWLKGLSAEGKATQNDAARFQQWESHGHIRTVQRSLDHYATTSRPRSPNRTTAHALPARPPSADMMRNLGTSATISSALPPMPSYGLAPGLDPSQNSSHVQSDSMSMDSQRSIGTNRASKSSRERAKIRSQKKNEIVERCRQLIPPISRDALEGLDAFDAALKIPIPLNENSWQILRDSLVLQRRKAVLADESKNAVRTPPIPGLYTAPTHTDEFLLAHASTSKKEKLCKLAEDFIRQKWGYGGFVTYPTSPQFAAEVLLHTRRAYVEERARIATIQASKDFIPFPIPQEDSLKLEDMKWVFDQTVKPRTEQIRKDLFICPVCPTVESIKHFAFESIIQHYASKHTDSFSRGTQMVNWKADWPASAPFSEHPERIHTPTPSVTHTPALTNVPLSTISSGSIVTSSVPSVSWYTPDNMSLASSTSRTYSAAGASVTRPITSVNAPGPAMYESHREDLSSSLLRSWNTIPSMPTLPASLRLSLCIALAVRNFKDKWSNVPGLALFRDSLEAKRDLETLRDIDNLRCAECAAAQEHDARARWSLLDLVIHFQNVHIDQHGAEAKRDWKTDMVLLPEPEVVRFAASDPALPEHLKSCLEDTIITSTLQYTNMAGSRLEPERKVVPDAYRSRGPENHVSTRFEPYPQTHAVYNNSGHYQSEFHDRSYSAQPRGSSSVAATYGDLSVTSDVASSSLSDVAYVQASDYPRRRYQHPAEHHNTQSYQPYRERTLRNVGTRQCDDDDTLPQGTSMTRTNTVRSYKSRDESRTTVADDFLSTIDAYVDTEMTDPQVHQNPSTNSGRSTSRFEYPASVTSTTLETNTQYASESPVGSNYISRDDSQAMRRAPSRVVEFSADGTPIPYVGQVYQEISPQRRAYRHERDIRTQSLMSLSSEDPRVFRQDDYHLSAEPTERLVRRIDPDQSYRRIEYIERSPQQMQRFYDPESGRWYMDIVAPVRRYIEIDESDHRTFSTHSAPDRSLHYRDEESQDYGYTADAGRQNARPYYRQ